jgi:hypothetical protein
MPKIGLEVSLEVPSRPAGDAVVVLPVADHHAKLSFWTKALALPAGFNRTGQCLSDSCNKASATLSAINLEKHASIVYRPDHLAFRWPS